MKTIPTREELEERARDLRELERTNSDTRALENELVHDIQSYVQAHPFETDEMGIVAGEAAQGPQHKICVTRSDMNDLVDALRQYKRVALGGEPGFGRLFAAQELGYILIGKEDPAHLAIVEFDSSYTFADFMGAGSLIDTFVQRGGLFYRLCQAAAASQDPYVLVINETAVGKLDSIFKQLEAFISSKGGQEALQVLYGTEEPFVVPDNVYILALTPVTAVYAIEPYSFVERTLKASMELSELIAEAQAADLEELREALAMVEAINSVVLGNSQLGADFMIRQNFICPCTLRKGDDVLAFTAERGLDPLIVEYTRLWASMWSHNRP